MGVLEEYRADRLLSRVLAAESADEPAVRDSMRKLRSLGRVTIPQLIEQLNTPDRRQFALVATVLLRLLDNDTLQHFQAGLTSSQPRIRDGLIRIFSRSPRFNPNHLIPLLRDPAIPKAALIRILGAHKQRVNVSELLQEAAQLDTADQAAVLKVVGEVADESSIPVLLERLESRDNVLRMHVVQILARFDTEQVRDALRNLLGDGNKTVRREALQALSAQDAPISLEALCELLGDPDLSTQQLAIDTMIRQRNTDTLRYIMEVLKDPSDYVRRAAVEVLNEIADADAVRDLLAAIRDQDWWVRERAGDALAKIGGPRVVEAMLELIKSDDEFIRRTAIEVINANRDPRAYDYLINALGDADWWVKERAIDALAGLHDPRAVAPLLRVMDEDAAARGVAIRALGVLGEASAIPRVARHLQDPDEVIQKEAIRTLEALTDEPHREVVEKALERMTESSDPGVYDAAVKALDAIRLRLNPELVRLDEAAASSSGGGEATATMTSAAVDISRLAEGDVLGDRYRFIQRVGRGAFGTVLLFEDTVVGEKVILKFLNPQFSSDGNVLKRFVQELRYARKVTHKNMIRIYDLLTFGTTSAISMEYFPSHTLANELQPDRPLRAERALNVAREIAFGMGAAHEAGVVHRDLKPANVLINDMDWVKVVDFGIAAAARSGESKVTRRGHAVGTPRYMAPEQVQGKAVDERTDVYSLGVILYEMLTGRPPYRGDDPIQVMYQHVHGKAVPVSYINKNIDHQLSGVVAKAMRVNPDDRQQSMEELRHELEACLER